MEFLELAKKRYSVRKFETTKVEQEKIDKILESAMVAPTAANTQSQRILVIQEEESMEKIRKATPCHFGAPLIILLCYKKDEAWVRKFDGKDSGEIDAGIIGTHMMMTATDIGLGSVWVMHYDNEILKKEFNISNDIEIAAMFSIGYTSKDAVINPMHYKYKDISQVVSYENF